MQMTIALRRQFVPVVSPGPVLTELPARPFIAAALARFYAADPEVTIESAGSTIADVVTLGLNLASAVRALAEAAQQATKPNTGGSAAALQTGNPVDLKAVTALRRTIVTGGLLLRSMPFSRAMAITSTGEVGTEARQLGPLLEQLRPIFKSSDSFIPDPLRGEGAARLHDVTDKGAFPIRTLALHQSMYTPLASTEFDTFVDALANPSRAGRVTDGSLMGLFQAISATAFLQAFPRLATARDVLEEPVELGLGAQSIKDATLRTGMQYVKVSLLLLPFAFLPYVAVCRVFAQVLKIPFIAKELEKLTGATSLVELTEATKAIAELPVPPILSEALRGLNHVPGTATPWGSNDMYVVDPAFALFDGVIASATTAGQLRANQQSVEALADVVSFRGGLISPALARIDVRSALVRRAPDIDPRNVAAQTAPSQVEGFSALHLLTKLRMVQQAAYSWLRVAGGTGLTANQVLNHYKQIAALCGWGAWSTQSVVASDALFSAPVTTDGLMSSSPLTSSFDFMTRRVVSVDEARHAPAVLEQTSEDRNDTGAAVEKNRFFTKIAHLVPILWLTSAATKDDTLIASGVDPREWVHGDDILLERFGDGAERMENNAATWAALAGIKESEVGAMIYGNKAAWAHLVTNGGDSIAFRPGFIYTSTTLRALGLNIRAYLGYVAPKNLFLMAEDRICDAYSVSKDLVDVDWLHAPPRASLVPTSDTDIRAVGIDGAAWVKRI